MIFGRKKRKKDDDTEPEVDTETEVEDDAVDEDDDGDTDSEAKDTAEEDDADDDATDATEDSEADEDDDEAEDEDDEAAASGGGLRIEKIETSGVFSLDGEDHDVENNVYLIGDDDEVIVVDAAHDAEAILAQVGEREVLAVICTHGHNDHVNAALEVAERDEAPIAMHRGDKRLWEMTHEDEMPDIDIEAGGEFEVGDTTITVLHTPGHSPGSICLYVEDLDVVFTGDTLFKGGPGATGRSFSDFPTILNSISDELLRLPKKTRVLPGHGEETTIRDEEKDYDAWVERGH